MCIDIFPYYLDMEREEYGRSTGGVREEYGSSTGGVREESVTRNGKTDHETITIVVSIERGSRIRELETWMDFNFHSYHCKIRVTGIKQKRCLAIKATVAVNG